MRVLQTLKFPHGDRESGYQNPFLHHPELILSGPAMKHFGKSNRGISAWR